MKLHEGLVPKDTLTITDNRTGKAYEVPITHDAIKAIDLRQIKVNPDDFGMMSFDPGFTNTAHCESSITYIDGDKGILRYRGYPIEQLAGKASFLEVSYLIMFGELPTKAHLAEWTNNIVHHTFLHENAKTFLDGFRYDAHPMGVFISTVAALSTFYPEANQIDDPVIRQHQIHRLIAKTPTIAAFAYRHMRGLPYAYPDNELSYAGNFLNMLFKTTEAKYKPNPVLEKALDVLFVLHADHEQNCSTSTVRMVGSSQANLYASIAAGVCALWGPLHGGANVAVMDMLGRLKESGEKLDSFIAKVKDKDGNARLMGFGHRVYKNFDPRAKIIKEACHALLRKLGINDPLLEIAMRLEEVALKDEYFIQRKLYPNVDYYSGIIMRALGIPTNMFTVMFAIGRLPGWIAHWREVRVDGTQ
ncbi:MAG: citrate synthase, partial [Actinomycetota bacterium]|nr:citrate synthase [Actinomycetota bacterium]